MDRRRQYRVPADDEDPLEVFVSQADGGRRTEAALVNLAVGGALVRVAAGSELRVPVGGVLMAWLVDRRSGIEVPMEARLVHRREEAAVRTLGLEFLDRKAAEGLLTPSLARMFNRRSAFRVRPDPHELIRVTLQGPALARLPLADAVLVDLSTGGLSTDVPVGFEAGMADHDEVECLFLPPGTQMPVSVPSRVRHRTLRGDRVRYGVMFADPDAPAFQRTFDAILAYVLRRQREMAAGLDRGEVSIHDILRSED